MNFVDNNNVSSPENLNALDENFKISNLILEEESFDRLQGDNHLGMTQFMNQNTANHQNANVNNM